MTNHLSKNHKISDLFRHLQVGQTECRKRRIWVGRVKLYISALRLEDGELLLVVSPMFNASAIRDYALRWEIETLFSCLKGRGFNLENTRLTDREFIGEKWFTWLIENDINFCIRVKKTLL